MEEDRGIGIDVCTVERVRELLDTDMGKVWMERIFTANERERMYTRFQSESGTQKARFAVHVAGMYAAKEAIAKATGKGLMGLGRLAWQDVEILHTEDGAPYAKIINGPGAGKKIHVSISHDGGMAIAVAIIWPDTVEKGESL
ncbi:MAG: holo-ACP synthase [bacterium]|nr:holo-ACP synthase [bacterium]